MTDRREMRIIHNFKQRYHGFNGFDFDRFEARIGTFDILEHLDNLEKQVYLDRDYLLANNMLNSVYERYNSSR